MYQIKWHSFKDWFCWMVMFKTFSKMKLNYLQQRVLLNWLCILNLHLYIWIYTRFRRPRRCQEVVNILVIVKAFTFLEASVLNFLMQIDLHLQDFMHISDGMTTFLIVWNHGLRDILCVFWWFFRVWLMSFLLFHLY